MTEDWFEETLHNGFRTRLRIEKLIYEGKSQHQHLVLFENAHFGRVLALNGVVQTTERDEFIYHEMLAHVPLLAHGQARDLLVIGGGDGGVLEEILKHDTIDRATLVEIDDSVVEFSKKYLRSICGNAFEDPRTDVVISDGVDYVTTTDNRYDIIIVDSTDPIGPGEVLFTNRFYTACKKCLNPGGILVTQSGVPFFQSDELRNTLAMLKRLFSDATCYTAAIPAYVGGCMSFGWASDDSSLRNILPCALESRYAMAGFETRYYTPAVHQAAFALPGYISKIVR